MHQVLFLGGGDSVNSTPLYYLSQLIKKDSQHKAPIPFISGKADEAQDICSWTSKTPITKPQDKILSPQSQKGQVTTVSLPGSLSLWRRMKTFLYWMFTQEKERKVPGPNSLNH